MAYQLVKPQEPERIIFDLETLDIIPTGIVLSFGATKFRLTEQDSFEDLVNRGVNIIFDIKCQREKGLTESPDTKKRWTQQSREAQDAVLGGTESPLNLKKILNETFGDTPLARTLWYCRGPHFDEAMMNHLCFHFNQPTPWKYSKIRDVRTWFDFHPKFEWNDEPPKGFIAHNSLHDSAVEALNMQQCWSKYYD